MNLISIVLVIAILSIYTVIWYYVGRKIKAIFIHKKFNFKIYWVIFWIIAFSYIISSILRSILSVNNFLAVIFSFCGAISLSLLVYLIIGFILGDLIKFVLRRVKLKENHRKLLKKIYGNGSLIVVTTIIVVCIGFYIALNPKVTEYSVDINKRIGNNTSLNIVLISDVHVGIGVREKGIDEMVDSINKLKPEIVFLQVIFLMKVVLQI